MIVSSHRRKDAQGGGRQDCAGLTTLLRDFPVPVYITHDGVFRFVNSALQTLSGYSESELLGKNIRDIISREDEQPGPDGGGIQARQPIKREISVLFRDGEKRKLLETVLPVLYEGRRVLLGTLIARAEDKSLEKRLVRINQILNVGQNISQLVALETNSDWLIKSACQIFASSQGFNNAWIALFDDSGELKSVAEGGLGDKFQSLIKALEQGNLPPCTRRALSHSGNVVIIVTVPEDCKGCPSPGEICGHTTICIRLGYQEKTYGVLSATLAEGTQFGQDEQALFREVAQNIAAALYNIELAERRRQDELQMERARILDLANDAFFVHDLDGNFTYVNEMACKMTGYAREELLAMNLRDTVAPQYVADIATRFKTISEEGEAIFESARLRKDGLIVPVEVHSGPIELGGVLVHYDIVRDITERKLVMEALRQSQERYRTLFNTLTDTVYIHDVQGRFLEINEVGCQRLGYQKAEVLKLNIENLIGHKLRTSISQMVEHLRVKSPIIFETTLVTRDGKVIPHEASTRLVEYEGKEAVLSVARDISERKAMERELENKVYELEMANERLRELDRLKDNFLSTVSHELRTPLTSIKSFAEILLNYEEDQDTQREFLGIINEESERLTRLINDFLDLSKIQAGRMQWQTAEVSVAAIAEAAINIARPVIEKEKLTLTVNIEPDLPPVLGDRDRLQQVITNLLGNAVKFTPEGGRVGIKSWFSKDNGMPDEPGLVIFSISDSGIGIAPENHEKIFENFGQVGDVLKDRPKGSGLGLPISKKIVENFGGKIWVESALGKGSTFFFSLLVAKNKVSQAPSEPKIEQRTPAPGGKTVLIVDDEANIRRIIRHELERHGHKIIEASGGIEAVELAKKHHPDLMTLDINMPDLDGFDVTAVLKNNPDTRKIPILIVSVVEDRQKAFQLGANDYITKPIIMNTLVERVNGLLRGAQKNILIADDDMSLVKSLRLELRKYGFVIDAAYNGRQAVKAVARHLPDLILLDIKMPEIDGYEVLKVLKDKPETRDIPIILMTDVDIDGGMATVVSLGATEYVQKSDGFSHLFEAIEKALAVKP